MMFVTLMRHSVATHNEAAAAQSSDHLAIYCSESFFDAPLCDNGIQMANQARALLQSLRPPPAMVLSSPLTRALQTAIIGFEGTGIPIVAVEGAREAHGVCPCDRRRPRAELETAFGDRVNFQHISATDPWWQRDARESTAHLQQRALRFLGEVLSLRETHVAVVSHGVFIEMLHDYFLRDWPGCAATRRVMNCDTCTYGFVMENGPPPQLGTYLNPSLLAKVVAAGMSLVEVAAACALWRKYVPGGAFTSSQECVASLITREGKASASQARLLAHVLAAGSAADGAVSQRALLRLLACFFPLQRATAPPLPPSIAHARAAYLKDLHGTELQDERALSAIIKGIVGSAAAAQSTSSCATSGGHSASATTE